MKKISLNELVNLINFATQNEEITKFWITEYDECNTFSVDVDGKEVIYFDILEEKKYDIIQKKLQKSFQGRFETALLKPFWGYYNAMMVIDERAVVFLDFSSSDGQNWLCSYFHE